MYYIYSLIVALHARVEDAKDRGATATEYAILITVVALVVAVGAGIFGGQLSDWFSGLADKIGLNK